MEAQLGNLVDQAIIKQGEDGNFWPVDDPEERQSIIQSKQRPAQQPQVILGAPDGDQLDRASHHSFRSAHQDEDLEDLS